MKTLLSAALAAGLLMTTAGFAQEAQPAQQTGAEPAHSPGAATSGETGMSPGASHSTPEAEAHSATPHYPLKHPATLSWSFSGPLGHWDVGQLQRGLKVYKEVCSNCHSLELVSFRDLRALGYNEAQVKGFAAGYQIQDPNPSATGEMVQRPGIPSDYFPSPFANAEAAAASNNGAAPPDLSLMAKARAVERGFPYFLFDIVTQYAQGGPDYIHALLTGYGQEPPAGVTIQPGTHYNPYFMNGPALAMPQPIQDGQVTYDDGAPQTVEQYSRDVAAFLMWTAEPHLAERKATGLVVMIFLIAFAVMLWLVKRRVWAGVAH
ncbi:ribosomal protein P2 [Aureimonas endophytica]|uniref:Cytochrome c1 n=1 Tax=Aureimonas endophytica TaxID=2027858 RepID=A0A916ZYH8_9HYPH|nr:cytochrome c1 [Aureimonas endophytica]GGE19207.1 ribosomal protein P2 [Aureimonas endophytica]